MAQLRSVRSAAGPTLRRPVTILVAGAVLAALAQVVLPVAVPLYDGVSVVEPYRYLAPPANQPGQPTSFQANLPVSGGQSPQITAATTENPPQAQLIALAGVFEVSPATAQLHVSIDPVPPAAPLSGGLISGNVYRIEVADPSGQPIALAPGKRPTLAMRAAGTLTDAAIFRLSGATWQRLETVSNASLQLYTAEPDTLGDFAVVDLAGGGISTTDLVVGGTIGLVIAAIAVWAIRASLRRRRPVAPVPPRRPPDSPRAGPASDRRPDPRPRPRNPGRRRP